MGSIRIIWGVEEIMGCYLSGGISLPDSYSPNGTNCTLSAASVQHRKEHMVTAQMGHARSALHLNMRRFMWVFTDLCETTEMLLKVKALEWFLTAH